MKIPVFFPYPHTMNDKEFTATKEMWEEMTRFKFDEWCHPGWDGEFQRILNEIPQWEVE